jgi:hypothetical protein
VTVLRVEPLRVRWGPMRHSVWLVALCALVGACGGGQPVAAPSTPPSGATSASPSTTTPPSATTTSGPTATAKPRPKPSTTPSPRSSTTQTPRPRPSAAAARPFTVKGSTRNAIAFAPLSNPGAVTIEGSVPSYHAWSTSKVLVVAAHLDTVVDGDPSRLTASQQSLVRRALTASDGDAVVALRNQIPGSPGAAINRVLRSIGDASTSAPDTSQGLMQWTIREQVRFMAALDAGWVVSPAASSYLLSSMRPISAHRWGLGTIGAGPFKGGWLRASTETRQMGIVGGYAVAVITYAQGPAVVQTDGDAAHVQQMNRIAAYLAKRLDAQ